MLSELPVHRRPPQLIVIDGTWHHAKTIVRDVPQLRCLPRIRLAPGTPGRFRIRREPNDQALSTLEAVVAALQVSEPNTQGLSELLAAFDAMVDGQLAHPNMKHHWRRNLKRSGDGKNIPRALAGDLNHVVAAYGESAPINGPDGTLRGPIYWVAERLGTGEQFAGKIMPREPLRSTFLDHLQLSNAEFENAGCVPSFRTAWNEFFRSDDTLAVYHKRTADLLKNISAAYEPHVVLKSIRLGDSPAPSGTRTLDQWLAALRISTPAARFPGRAGQRLAQASALIQYLHAQAE